MSSIQSRSNKQIKKMRALQQRKGRKEQAAFLLEGQTLIQMALDNGFELQTLLHTSEQPPLKGNFSAYHVSQDVLQSLSSLNTPPGTLAQFAQKETGFDTTRHPLRLISSGVQDPGNFGALLRLVDGLGMQGVYTFDNHVDPFHPRVLRGSMGSSLRVGISGLSVEHLRELQAEGWQVVTCIQDAEHTSLSFQYPQKTLLVLGSEGQGIAPELLKAAQTSLSIPLAKGVESFNVATAGAILMYEYLRQVSA